MKFKTLILAGLLVLAFTGSAYATVGTCTLTSVTSTQNANSRVPDSYTVDMVVTCIGGSDGSLAALTIPLSGASNTIGTLNAYNLFGYYLYQIGRTPGNVSASQSTCSATCPTNGYTVTLTDAQGFALDLALLTSNGSGGNGGVAQLNVINNYATNYPAVRNGALSLAVTGNSVASAKIVFDLIFKSQ
jgi:hypothetical protein